MSASKTANGKSRCDARVTASPAAGTVLASIGEIRAGCWTLDTWGSLDNSVAVENIGIYVEGKLFGKIILGTRGVFLSVEADCQVDLRAISSDTGIAVKYHVGIVLTPVRG